MTPSFGTAEPPVLDCEQTVRRLWDYLDRQLSDADMYAVDQHLRECKAKCASHFAFERAFLDVLRASRPTVVASESLRTRVAAVLAPEGFINDSPPAANEDV